MKKQTISFYKSIIKNQTFKNQTFKYFWENVKHHAFSCLSQNRIGKEYTDKLGNGGCVCVCVCVCVYVCVCACVCSVVSDSLLPNFLQSVRLCCPWNFPGKNTAVGCHFLLQGIFLTHGSNLHHLHLLHCQADSLLLCLLPGNGMVCFKHVSSALMKKLCKSHYNPSLIFFLQTNSLIYTQNLL